MNITKLHARKQRPMLVTPAQVAIVTVLAMAGCSTAMKAPDGAVEARNRLVELQNDATRASRVSVAIRTADVAVTKAEVPHKDQALSDHLVFLAAREVDIAWVTSETRLLESKRDGLSSQREASVLAARTREADQANIDAAQARADNADLRRRISELDAKASARGLVVTLGDMLFETGLSTLTGDAAGNLGKLSDFMIAYPARTLVIEGHTDNVGSESSNMLLSQQRADAVERFLLEQGVSADRIGAFGKGENFPVASNASVSGRSLNRRVEVIINNLSVAASKP